MSSAQRFTIRLCIDRIICDCQSFLNELHIIRQSLDCGEMPPSLLLSEPEIESTATSNSDNYSERSTIFSYESEWAESLETLVSNSSFDFNNQENENISYVYYRSL
jgi:hypothetical protein